MFYPKTPVVVLWTIHDVVRILVAIIFSFALAKKSNQEFLDLQELKNKLEIKVLEKTKELQKAKEKIEEASNQRTNYFVNLAHEIKTY